MKVTAVIPVREGSERVPNKNFKTFAGSSLLELKLELLKKVSRIDKVVVNTDSDTAIQMAKDAGANYFRREPYYASSACTNSEFWRNLAETTDTEYIIHTNCTSPMVSLKTYENFLDDFENHVMGGNYDSVNTVRKVREFLWHEGKSLNYDSKNTPNSQDLPNIVALTFGISILRRETMIERANVVGHSPYLHVVNSLEAVDIDEHLDFEFAEFLYRKVNEKQHID